jgi:hypothetical protein
VRKKSHIVRYFLPLGKPFFCPGPTQPGRNRGVNSSAFREGEIAVVPTVPVPRHEVTLVEGAFSGLRALVAQYFPAKERVRVLLMLLGRGHEVDLPVSAVVVDRPSAEVRMESRV